MQLIEIEHADVSLLPSVVSVGNFDGIHRGHQALVKEVVERAQRQKARSVVVTFEPHTRTVLSPGVAVPLLTTLAEKRAILEKLGVDMLAVIRFNSTIAEMCAESFVQNLLMGKLGAVEWVMGESHRWGHNRWGAKEILHNLGGEKHFFINVFTLVEKERRPISSTGIRALILQGEVNAAIETLGHPYVVATRRIRGVGKAGALGFPTVNLEAPSQPKLLPPSGVYAGRLQWRDGKVKGAVYFGSCPTYGQRETHFEFHSLEPLQREPVPTEEVFLWLEHMLRRDCAFKEEALLREQISKDVENIRSFFQGE